MSVDILKLHKEISDVLAQKNIFTDKDWDMSVYYGLVLNVLTHNEMLEKSISIINNPLQLPDKDYNLIFVSQKIVVANQTISDMLKNATHNAVLEKYVDQQWHMTVYFYTITLEDRCYSIVQSTELVGEHTHKVMLSLLPKLFGDLFTPDKIRPHMPYLLDISKNYLSRTFDDIILSKCEIDLRAVELESKKRQLMECAGYMARKRTEQARQEYNEILQRCKCYMDNYNKAIDQLNDCLQILNGSTYNDVYMQNFVDYLLSNKKIRIVSVGENRIVYDVYGWLDYFDPEQYELVTNQKDSGVYDICDTADREIVHQILDDIFIHQKMRVNTVARFMLRIDNCAAITIGDKPDCINRCPAPHVHIVQCAGNFPPIWNAALAENNYMLAIATTINYASNLTWKDYVVVGNFMSTITYKKCIEDQQGQVYSLSELIEKYRKDEVTKNE